MGTIGADDKIALHPGVVVEDQFRFGIVLRCGYESCAKAHIDTHAAGFDQQQAMERLSLDAKLAPGRNRLSAEKSAIQRELTRCLVRKATVEALLQQAERVEPA